MSLLKNLCAMILTLTVLSHAHAAEIPGQEKIYTPYGTERINPKEIVFIHGLFVTPKCWDEWKLYFADLGYQVSAPAYPYHQDVQALRKNPEVLKNLKFEEVLNHYREILKAKATKPILIGHSMGGLLVQLLMSEGLGEAAVVIHSAPPKGFLTSEGSFYKANKGVFNPLAYAKPMTMSEDEFSYAFTSAQHSNFRKQVYEEFYVPESRKVARGPLLSVSKLRLNNTAPILFLAGGQDNIIPASLAYKNFQFYKNEKKEYPGSYSEFKLYPDRDHWTLGAPGWEYVANDISIWLKENLK